MKTSEILQRARAELLRRGWCQGRFVGIGGTVCASQAIWSAADRGVNSVDAKAFFSHVTGDADVAVSSWNDQPGRTLGDVLAALDIATSAALSDEAVAE